jgi:hypothetical protein
MAFVPTGYGEGGTFEALPFGAIFRVGDLPPGQVMIKAAGPSNAQAWWLVLGGGFGGRYPSPYYGAMTELADAPIWAVKAPVAIAANGPRVDQPAGGVVYPGYLVVLENGRKAVFVGGTLCIDLKTGRRFRINVLTAVAYGRWVIDVTIGDRQSTLLYSVGPMERPAP